ncbi:hypothetical protein B0T26DRAFT_765951 [Lasiosphaeria miniovina]|uniref:Ankyrin repeat protein n=1 Tax=Lasiosphaeria miniovina TaxID=1954250 RepID=A0AA40B4M1_9PEZI|nr:uncharacterized protein B0T26DRAFT_765951 [Lasiosphaeria miniovina]KAK0727634.1 hypothetical protein B0T26DRAFT_765951 [Lasiosphaeria miniovina]
MMHLSERLQKARAEADLAIGDLIDGTLRANLLDASCLRGNENLANLFKHDLLEKANGDMLYARVALAIIVRKVPATEDWLDAFLEELPEDVPGLYMRTLLRVPEMHRETVRRALVWQRFTFQKMSLGEFGEALRVPLEPLDKLGEFKLGDFELGEPFPDPLATVDMLPGILFVRSPPSPASPSSSSSDGNNNDNLQQVQIGHGSFLDFIESELIKRPGPKEAQDFAMDKAGTKQGFIVACLRYFLHAAGEVRDLVDKDEILRAFPLAECSAKHGLRLVEGMTYEKQRPEPLENMMRQIFSSKDAVRLLNLVGTWSGTLVGFEDFLGPLSYPIGKGQLRILRFLLRRRNDDRAGTLARISAIVTEEDVNAGLHQACASNNYELVEFLLFYGADGRAPAGKYLCAADTALQHGSDFIVKILLNGRNGIAQSCAEKKHPHLVTWPLPGSPLPV